MPEENIALVFLNVGSLAGGGGAERQFANVFEGYSSIKNPSFNLFFITDTRSYKNFRAAGLLSSTQNLILLKTVDRLPLSLNSLLWGLQLLAKITAHKLKLIHICLLGRFYIVPLSLLRLMPGKARPKVSVNIVDCTLAHWLQGEEVPDSGCNKEAHRWILEKCRIDGLFVWYELFKKAAESTLKFPQKVYIQAAKYCFADTSKYKPSPHKKNEIVFAARMLAIKCPLLFIDSLRHIRDTEPEALNGWHFSMYGKGPLEDQVRAAIEEFSIGEHVTLSFTTDMAKVFASSRAFISTQDLENFTSLSMMEAMAAGNAIIARNVGQTHYFVKDNSNGFIAKGDDSASFAGAILKYIRNPDRHEEMMQESIRLATEVHTLGNFITDIESFWINLLKR